MSYQRQQTVDFIIREIYVYNHYRINCETKQSDKPEWVKLDYKNRFLIDPILIFYVMQQ